MPVADRRHRRADRRPPARRRVVARAVQRRWRSGERIKRRRRTRSLHLSTTHRNKKHSYR